VEKFDTIIFESQSIQGLRLISITMHLMLPTNDYSEALTAKRDRNDKAPLLTRVL